MASRYVEPAYVHANRVFVRKPCAMLSKSAGKRLVRSLADIQKSVGVTQRVTPVDLIQPIVVAIVVRRHSAVVQVLDDMAAPSMKPCARRPRSPGSGS
jgi:hypothetical protein